MVVRRQLQMTVWIRAFLRNLQSLFDKFLHIFTTHVAVAFMAWVNELSKLIFGEMLLYDHVVGHWAVLVAKIQLLHF